MRTLGSIIISAHNEEAVIGRTLGLLSDVAAQGLIDVVVVCNGCQDRTAQVARTFPGVRVLDLPQPSKTAALRAGDRVAVPGPRIYLDADIDLTSRAATDTMHALAHGAIAGRPPRIFETEGAVWAVRRWYALRERLPSIEHALWGAGCYALSERGRARFGEFPETVADDLFIDGLFAPEEVTIVPTDPVVVHTPRRLGDLLLVLRRKYRSQPAEKAGAGVVSSGQRSQLRDVQTLVRLEPARSVDAAVYATLIVAARVRARFGPAPRWERDESSRRLSGPPRN